MKIDQIFAAENFNEPHKIEWIKQEAGYLLKIIESDPNFILAERLAPSLPPAALAQFFRHRERNEMICQTIQYLLTFLAHVPTPSEIGGGPVNPAEQFRAFICYQTDLLLEDDVRNAIFHETNFRKSTYAGTVWDFQERTLIVNRRLKNMIDKQEQTIACHISNQCRVLEQLCLFWFELRCHDLRRTRRSDIFMYLLAQLVRLRCWQVNGQGPGQGAN